MLENQIESIQARKSIEQSTIWNKVRPLFMRGAIASEIATITGFDHKQVNNSIHRRFKSTGSRRLISEDMFAPAKTSERMTRGRLGKPKYLAGRLPPTQEEKNSITFAKIAQEKGLFTDDLSYWNKLTSLYESLGRELPPSFYDRLRLEAFLKVIVEGLQGNNGLRDKFRAIGEEIDRKWFYDQSSSVVRQQVFIRGQLKTFKH